MPKPIRNQLVQSAIIRRLLEHGPHSVRGLVDALKIPKNTVARALDRLELEHNMVRREKLRKGNLPAEYMYTLRTGPTATPEP